VVPVLFLTLALSWVQVRSDVFVVKSSAGIERAKRVLRELEEFREIIGTTLVFRNVALPELPIEVLLIGDQAQYAELSPVYNGKPVRVAGFFERGQDRDFIVLQGNSTGNFTHVVYHELTHSFISRSLDVRLAWLSEGLAEYFSTADIQADNIYLGGLSNERLDVLKGGRMMRLAELLAVDDQSPYYNESDKANLFYAQAWAFVHFLMHGPHQKEFKSFLEALTRGAADFASYVQADVPTLEVEFEVYLKSRIRLAGREKVKAHPEVWQMSTEPVTSADAELAITELFLSSGRLQDARTHLERVADDQFPRASYYRGVLARITKEEDPTEFFIDALMDPNFGPRAAIHLVQLHELSVPGARRALEQAAASGTHIGDVYWALSEIYLEDARKAWGLMEVMGTTRPLPGRAAAQRRQDSPPESGGVPRSAGVVPSTEPPEVPMISYAHGDGDHFKYELFSASGGGPNVRTLVAPYFPDELLNQRVRGKVVVDVQVTETGEVAGIWMISALPEILGDLATAAVHDWKFNGSAGKIRVTVQFIP
jgi:hypothetical protein